jgi:hypothetical protein
MNKLDIAAVVFIVLAVIVLGAGATQVSEVTVTEPVQIEEVLND